MVTGVAILACSRWHWSRVRGPKGGVQWFERLGSVAWGLWWSASVHQALVTWPEGSGWVQGLGRGSLIPKCRSMFRAGAQRPKLFCLITRGYAIAKWKNAISEQGLAIGKDPWTNVPIDCALREYPEAIKEQRITLENAS